MTEPVGLGRADANLPTPCHPNVQRERQMRFDCIAASKSLVCQKCNIHHMDPHGGLPFVFLPGFSLGPYMLLTLMISSPRAAYTLSLALPHRSLGTSRSGKNLRGNAAIELKDRRGFGRDRRIYSSSFTNFVSLLCRCFNILMWVYSIKMFAIKLASSGKTLQAPSSPLMVWGFMPGYSW